MHSLLRRAGFACMLPRLPEEGERADRRAREVDMGANFAIVTLVLVFAVVIGVALGRKLRRK